MTDPFSAPRRIRRRSGRHRQQPVRRAESTPLPKEQARRNRDAAFGAPNPKRTWIDTPAASASAPSAPEAPADEPRTADAPRSDDRPAESPAPRAATPASSSRTVRGARSTSRTASSSSTGSLPHTAERRSFPGVAGPSRSDADAAAPDEGAKIASEPSRVEPDEAVMGGAEKNAATGPRASSAAAAAAQPEAQGPERTIPRRPRGRRAAFPLEQLESSADPASNAPAASASAISSASAPGSPAAGASAPSPAPRGRRAASAPSPAAETTPASTTAPSETDAWTTSEATSSTSDAPLAPGDEAAPATPSPAEPAEDDTAATEALAPVESTSDERADGAVDERTAHRTDDRDSSAAAAALASNHDAARDEESREDRERPVAVAAASLGAAGAGSAVAGGSGGRAGAGSGSGGSGPGGSDRRGSGGGDDRSGSDSPGSDRSRGSASDDGSLAKVAGWTVLTAALPGSGLVTTRLRQIGVIMLAVLLLAVATIAAVLVIGDPLRIAATLGTHRGVLIGALVVAVVVGLVWCLQIVLANLAQTTKQRLEGAKRYLALALAAVMVIAVAVPFGRGVQSLWALQGLFGSTRVFGGEGDGLAKGSDPWADTPRLNIMLLGQDAGADRTGTRPDTIMVASIDTETGQTALFSIPRNLENVEFPEGTVAAEEFPDGFDYYGKNENLINAVWAWAEENKDLFPGDPEPGLTATRWAVEETLGISTDYYAMVNLKGFEDLVNALGGVDLVVERRIPIGGGASEVEGYIEPGEQTLDGYHALWYARSREGSDDFNRMCRQQRIVRAVSEEADPTSLALSIPRLVTATEENIQTDIPVGNVDAFVELALRIKDGGFTSYPITQDVTFSGNPDWEYLEEWVDASIQDSMKQDPPESVQGETEPGSTEPAETGAPPEEDTAPTEEPTSEAPTTEETTEEETTEEESTAEEASSSATASAPSEEATPTDAPEIEQDPLKSCLPGAAG